MFYVVMLLIDLAFIFLTPIHETSGPLFFWIVAWQLVSYVLGTYKGHSNNSFY